MSNQIHKKKFGNFTVEIETDPWDEGVSDSTVTHKNCSEACSLQLFLECGLEGEDKDYVASESVCEAMEQWAYSVGW